VTKSLLYLYIQKVAAGDTSYTDRLVHRLAERLLYVPVTTSGRPEARVSGGSVKVEVVLLKETERSLVPAFTEERLLRNWCSRNGYSGESITLLGADLCAAIAAETWLWVNPGDGYAIELQPVLVEKIRQTEIDTSRVDEIEEAAASGDGQDTEDDRLDYQPQEDVHQAESVSYASAALFNDEENPPPAPEPEKKKKRSFLGFLKSK